MSVHTPSATRQSLHSQPLVRLVQTAVVVLTIVGLALVVLGIPHEYALLSQPCVACEGPQLSPVGAARLAEMGLAPELYAAYQLAFELLYVVIWTTVGALLFWRRREDSVALLVALTLVSFGMAFPNILTSTGQAYPVLQPLILWINYVAIVTFVAFFYVFPDGRFVPRWTGGLVAAWALVSLGAIWLLAHDLFGSQAAASAGRTLYFSLYYALLAGGVVAQIWRYRRTGDQVQRQQTKWVVSAICVAIMAFLVFNIIGSFVPHELNEHPATALLIGPLFYLGMQLIPIAIGVSVLRYRLWEIDLLLSRTLVYGILTACGVLVYVLVVGGLGTLFQARGNPLIALTATGVVAVIFQPLRERLQHTINQVVYGERDDPYRALSTLGRRLEATMTPDMVLPTLAEAVAAALRLPYVALLVQQGDTLVVAAEYPKNDTAPVPSFLPAATLRGGLDTLPLLYQGEQVGELRMAQRTPGEPASAADRRLLADLARQAGAVLHAVRLTADLRASREHIVMMREDERRRLRRDLHDGLGPTLASHTMQLEAARDLLETRPDAATGLLAKILGQSRQLLGDIQRLIDELRPPTLDELGLCGAIRHMVAQYEHGDLQIDVDVPDHMPELPAAVEVACYRIVQEALTNVVRHARARHCRVRLTASDILVCLEIGDDGVGIAPGQRLGVGLQSIRERSDALGGLCSIKSSQGKGLSVMVFLPVPAPDDEVSDA